MESQPRIALAFQHELYRVTFVQNDFMQILSHSAILHFDSLQPLAEEKDVQVAAACSRRFRPGSSDEVAVGHNFRTQVQNLRDVDRQSGPTEISKL